MMSNVVRLAIFFLISAIPLQAFAGQRVATLWWVIFNSPENCITAPGEDIACGGVDVFGQPYLDSLMAGEPDPSLITPNLAADIAVTYGTGAVTTQRGRVRLIGSIFRSNAADVPLDLSGGTLIDPLGLGNAYTNVDAEVHVVVRDHGAPIRENLQEQLLYFLESNCSDPSLGFVGGGPNICKNLQDATFAPAEAGEREVTLFGTDVLVEGARAVLYRNGDNMQVVVETIIPDDEP